MLNNKNLDLNDETLLADKKHFHFIGIGGSGMFPLVQILHAKGVYITGSDNNETDTLQIEREMGIPITLGQRAENIAGADVIVYTAAIMADNPELIAAQQSDALLLERSQLLGILSRHYSNCICVCGTHGKTTTTGLLTQLLLEGGEDPTAVIGGKLPLIHGSGRVGHTATMVCEAGGFVDTCLKLAPDVAVILNIDADHLDYFKTVENIVKSFRKFASMTTKELIINGDDARTLKAVEGLEKRITTFGFGEQNDYYPANITKGEGAARTFDLMRRGEKIAHVTLHIPGEHNIYNAMAAMVAAIHTGIDPQTAADSVAHFGGTKRRFEILGKVKGFTVADDYAHHPAELKVTLTAAQDMGFQQVWAVFQPFTFSRTSMLLEEFAQVLPIADHVVLTPIMGSREKNTYGIHATDLGQKIPGCVCLGSFEEIADYILQHAQPGDLVITLGCGDVYKCAKLILERGK